jgi:hypothetical protein
LLLEFGYVAHKKQREINVPILKDDQHVDFDDWAESLALRLAPGWTAGGREIEYWLRIAMPEMTGSKPYVQGARVSAGIAGGHAVTVPVEDIAGRARQTFADEYSGILLKTLARGLSKYVAKQKADDQGVIAGILANIFGAATEAADTRNWLTLPNSIAMVRLALPPGEYDLQVELIDINGLTVGTEIIDGIIVRAGDWCFMSRRVF